MLAYLSGLLALIRLGGDPAGVVTGGVEDD
jgi:hypothetical protein